jgi:tRNA-dependent cyclodipeptide synthase
MTVTAEPLTADCRRVLEFGECILVGLSPYNSFYRPAAVEALVTWAAARFDRVEVLLPGYEAAYAAIAAGRAPRDAVRSALRAVQQLRVPARRALTAAGRADPDALVHTWTRLVTRPRYRELRAAAEHAYRTSPELRALCDETSRDGLVSALGREPTADEVAGNLGYVLAEVPFFVDVPGILGVQTAVFVYNRPSSLVEALFAGVVPELTPARGHASAVVHLVPDGDGAPPAPRHALNGAAAVRPDPDINGAVLRWPLPFGEHGTPPPLFARLRAERPVCPLEMPSGQRMWLLTRRDDILRAAADPRLSRDLTYEGAPRIAGDDFNAIPGGIFNLDPPAHTRVRRILQPLYQRGAVEAMRPMIAAHAAELLDAMDAGPNPADLVAAYASPLALRVSCEVLRIPLEQRRTYLSLFRTQTDYTADPAEIGASTEAITELSDSIVAGRQEPPDPGEPLGALILAHRDGVISRDELVGTVAYLLVTGADPVVGPLATGTLTLLRHRDQLDEVLADPGLWPAAVEEILRYHHNGFLSNPRVALEDVEIRGVTVRAGEAVVTPFLAALWDPEHVRDPHRFRIRRSGDATAGFGHGPHHCLGSSLARVHLATALEALFTRHPDLTLAVRAEDVPWEEEMLFARPALLPVTW